MQVGIEVLSKIPPENRREFVQSFKILPQFEGCRKNCTFFQLFEDVGELNRFLWVEHWANKKSLQTYMESDRFKSMMGAIDALGELININKIQVKKIQ